MSDITATHEQADKPKRRGRRGKLPKPKRDGSLPTAERSLFDIVFGLFFRKKGMNPIVPEQSVASQTLVIVVAIMSFLTCLTFGAVTMVWQQASAWEQDIAREVTIQIRPVEGVAMDAEIAKARDLAQRTPGISNVILLDDSWSERLLEPWLGKDFNLEELPVPRILVLELDRTRPANLQALSERIAGNVQGASFDDHSLWLDRLTSMANAIVAVGLGLMVLMLTAMVLSITFATSSAMTSSHEVVEVLHFVGAKDAFIANEFQQRFLVLGLQGGLFGGVLAILSFFLLNLWTGFVQTSPQGEQLNTLFGRFEIGLAGYIGTVFLILIVALLTALSSRISVFRYLTRMT